MEVNNGKGVSYPQLTFKWFMKNHYYFMRKGEKQKREGKKDTPCGVFSFPFIEGNRNLCC